MAQFNLPLKERRLVEELDKLAKFGYPHIKQLKKMSPQRIRQLKDLQSATLSQLIGIAHHLTTGIIAVARAGLPEVGIILLRSLLEVSFNAMYILLDKTGRHALAFYITAEKKRRENIEEQIKFVEEHPEYAPKLLPKRRLSLLQNQLDNDIASHESKYGKLNFPDIRARAVWVDKIRGKPDNELMYITVYKHFSDYVHLSARGLNNFLRQTKKAIEFLLEPHAERLDILLISTYGLYLGFLGSMSEHFGIPPQKELLPFGKNLEELIGGKIHDRI